MYSVHHREMKQYVCHRSGIFSWLLTTNNNHSSTLVKTKLSQIYFQKRHFRWQMMDIKDSVSKVDIVRTQEIKIQKTVSQKTVLNIKMTASCPTLNHLFNGHKKLISNLLRTNHAKPLDFSIKLQGFSLMWTKKWSLAYKRRLKIKI